MINFRWESENGTELECRMCKHYPFDEEDKIRIICLGCRHEYDAHSEEDVKYMDYPKPDLFEPIENDSQLYSNCNLK